MTFRAVTRRKFLASSSIASATIALSPTLLATVCGAPDESREMLAVARNVFPHPRVGDGPWVRALESFGRSNAERSAFLNEMREATGNSFDRLPAARQLDALMRYVDTPFFTDLVAHLRAKLYLDPEVWSVIGYEGPSLEFGGYLERGFDDIDWLPEGPGGVS